MLELGHEKQLLYIMFKKLRRHKYEIKKTQITILEMKITKTDIKISLMKITLNSTLQNKQ